jgi:hypothetical protein
MEDCSRFPTSRKARQRFTGNIREEAGHAGSRQLAHPCRLVDRVDSRRKTKPLRCADRARARPPIVEPHRPTTLRRRPPNRDKGDMLHRPQHRSHRPHLGNRTRLETDDHRIVVEEL